MGECHVRSHHFFVNNLLEGAATALKFGKSWTDESTYKEELPLLGSDSLHLPGFTVRTSDEGWKGRRMVGAVEERRAQSAKRG